MAQEIITLAREETSQDILERVKSLQLAVGTLDERTTTISDAQKWGGVDSTYSTTMTTKTMHVVITGRSIIFLYVRTNQVKVVSIDATIDGKNWDVFSATFSGDGNPVLIPLMCNERANITIPAGIFYSLHTFGKIASTYYS